MLSALRLGPTRRNDLIERIAGISDKVLTESLRRLQERRLIAKDQPASSDRAVYRLTDLGESFANGPLAGLARWAADNQGSLAGVSTTT